MKKILLILIASFGLHSCFNYIPVAKPFVIVSKRPYVWYDNQVTLYLQEYTYKDSSGLQYYFFEKDIYQVGDTIK